MFLFSSRGYSLCLRFEVLLAVKMSVLVACVVIMCGIVGRYQCFHVYFFYWYIMDVFQVPELECTAFLLCSGTALW
jgi:hypothetical protein